MVVRGVSLRAVQRMQAGRSFACFGLLPHENKLSVLNFNIQRVGRYEEPIKGKEELVFVVSERAARTSRSWTFDAISCSDFGKFALSLRLFWNCVWQAGHRTFSTKPIYSEPNLNSDKHKMERFLQPGRFSMASVFGPISLMPCPLLAFKRMADGRLLLVATGSLQSVDPDRIVLKKVNPRTYILCNSPPRPPLLS